MPHGQRATEDRRKWPKVNMGNLNLSRRSTCQCCHFATPANSPSARSRSTSSAYCPRSVTYFRID